MIKNTTLQELKTKGFKIERIKELDTYGLGSMGLLVRAGIRVTDSNGNSEQYQITFNSRKYGNATQEIKQYNGKLHTKHFEYLKKVNEWLAKHELEVVNIL